MHTGIILACYTGTRGHIFLGLSFGLNEFIYGLKHGYEFYNPISIDPISLNWNNGIFKYIYFEINLLMRYVAKVTYLVEINLF